MLHFAFKARVSISLCLSLSLSFFFFFFFFSEMNADSQCSDLSKEQQKKLVLQRVAKKTLKSRTDVKSLLAKVSFGDKTRYCVHFCKVSDTHSSIFSQRVDFHRLHHNPFRFDLRNT